MFTRKQFVALSCGFLLLGSVALYLYQQNTPVPEPIKV